MPPWKPTSKVAKDPDSIKFKVFTPLMPKEVPIEAKLLASVTQLYMEDWDLSDREKFPLLDPNKYLKAVYYEEVGFTRLEPMKCVAGIEHARLMNMLYVPHFGRRTINSICVCQLLALVHDECLWMGEPIPIDDMLIRRITVFPYQGMNFADAFVGKSLEKKLADQMKSDFRLIKKSRVYAISSITNEAIQFATQILAGRIMRKCQADEVPTPMVSLVV